MKATLWRMTARPTVTDEDGTERPASDAELLNMGVKVVGEEGGDEIAHVEPGTEPPGTAVRLKGPGWRWSDLKDELPDVASQVLEAVWEETDEEGNTVRRRGPQGPARSRGNIPTSVAEDLPPHFWAGDA